MNTNGVLSFGQPFTAVDVTAASTGPFTPPIITPFWDDIDIRDGGMIYYRQEFNSSIADLVSQDLSSRYPEVGFFYPSLVFVVTWDRVAAYSGLGFGGLSNTFQAIIASDGSRSFVRFFYDNIEWGSNVTLIGVSAGDGLNFVTHPASLSPDVLVLDGTNVTYRIDCKLSLIWLFIHVHLSSAYPAYTSMVDHHTSNRKCLMLD